MTRNEDAPVRDNAFREQQERDYKAMFGVALDDSNGLEMSDDSRDECGHPYKRGDETHYPECSRINGGV